MVRAFAQDLEAQRLIKEWSVLQAEARRAYFDASAALDRVGEYAKEHPNVQPGLRDYFREFTRDIYGDKGNADEGADYWLASALGDVEALEAIGAEEETTE